MLKNVYKNLKMISWPEGSTSFTQQIQRAQDAALSKSTL